MGVSWMLGSSHRRRHSAEHLSVNPLFAQGSVLAPIPTRRLPAGEMSSSAAYQVIHDELMLDGNARQNLATFVTTWMEPEVASLMAECLPRSEGSPLRHGHSRGRSSGRSCGR